MFSRLIFGDNRGGRHKPIEIVVHAGADDRRGSVKSSEIIGKRRKGTRTRRRRYPSRVGVAQIRVKRFPFDGPFGAEGIFHADANDPANARCVNVEIRRIPRG